MDNIILYTPIPEKEHFVPILSFNIEGKHSEETAALLASSGIAVRAGLHCAPCAHEEIGTVKTGAVRISPSVFTSFNDIEKTLFSIRKIITAK